MEQYVAFLRGINISGKNKVSMAELKTELTSAGFTEVRTYINSGNIVFTSAIMACEDISNIIKQLLLTHFDVATEVLIIPIKELKKAVEHAPSWWLVEKDIVTYGIFAIPPKTTEDVFAAVGEINPELEKIASYENTIFWSTPRKTFNKARWSKIASSTINNAVTIRTVGTILKVLDLAK